jgi:hypothetical protein
MLVADGKLLFKLGCPQKRIKFFVGKQHESEAALIAAFSEVKVVVKEEWADNSAYRILQRLRDDEFGIPGMMIHNIYEKVSNSELLRWLRNSAIHINEKAVKPEEIIDVPIKSLIFFPNAKRKTTLI